MTTFATLAVPLYAIATVALWFVSSPPGVSRWRLASVSALVAAGVALVARSDAAVFAGCDQIARQQFQRFAGQHIG